ncbi:type II toxin-antitoxin system VapC family toxin [Flavitalea flava]
MGIKYLWDTNTAIYYLQKQFPAPAEEFMDGVLKLFQPAISAITEIELLCWKTATENDLVVLKNFIADCVVFELETELKFKTAELRKSYKIKLPDAIIGATALVLNLTLLTRNISDFRNIPDLDLINPWDQ